MNDSVCGNALALPYPDGIAQTCVTSPPYYQLRDYGVSNQLGQESTPEEYVKNIVAAMGEVYRVLRDDGTLWLNLGDSYASSSSGGIKQKDLIGIPWMVAFALRDAGWYLRADVIWSKPNSMPESVTDRPTKTHEHVFLFAKKRNYFYDAEAVKEPNTTVGDKREGQGRFTYDGKYGAGREDGSQQAFVSLDPSGRNARSVWTVASFPYQGAHYATMPPDLARRCILAGTSARGQCKKCGSPWIRVMEKTGEKEDAGHVRGNNAKVIPDRPDMDVYVIKRNVKTQLDWQPTCECNEEGPVPQIVLDPFMGSGTTAMAALQAGRRAIGTELNPVNFKLQSERTLVTLGLNI